MYKLKTKSAAKKRFFVRKNKNVYFFKTNRRHNLTNKTAKQKRNYRNQVSLKSIAQQKTIKNLLYNF